MASINDAHPGADEVFRGAEWSICHAPDRDGVLVSEIDVWRTTVMGQGSFDLPPHHIYYAFDDSEVRFLIAKRA